LTRLFDPPACRQRPDGDARPLRSRGAATASLLPCRSHRTAARPGTSGVCLPPPWPRARYREQPGLSQETRRRASRIAPKRNELENGRV